jgi:hypothetical protein
LPLLPSHSNFQDQSIALSGAINKNSYGQVKNNPPSTLQLDIVNRQQQLEFQEKQKLKKQRKAKWTVICVSLALLTMCITLVGTMLSIGSNYQDRISRNRTVLDVARSDHWINMRNNSEPDSSHSLLLSNHNKSSLNPSILPKITRNSFHVRNLRQALEGDDFNFNDLFVITPKVHNQVNDDDRYDYIATHQKNATKYNDAQDIL